MFDLDGTLIETAPEICDAVNDTLQQFGLAAGDSRTRSTAGSATARASC